MFVGMSIDVSAQTTMSASKTMYAPTPNIVPATQTTIVRPGPVAPVTITRGVAAPTNQDIQPDRPTYDDSDLNSLDPTITTPVALPIIRKKKV